MASDPEQLFPDADEGAVIAFRWTDYDVPFWARENSRDGRWNYADQGITQYWSLTPEAAWAELVRAEDLRTEEDLDEVRMPIWIARIPSLGLVDLRTPDGRGKYGISADALTDSDWTPCQEVAADLRKRGSRGVMTPSAALSGHASLTLFGPRRAINWASRPALASTVPAARVATGRPPPEADLLTRVRRREPPGPLGERLF